MQKAVLLNYSFHGDCISIILSLADLHTSTGVPKATIISKLEGYINTQNASSFFIDNDINTWYLNFELQYGLGAGNRKTAEIRLSDPQGTVDVFHEITHKQETYMFLVLANIMKDGKIDWRLIKAINAIK